VQHSQHARKVSPIYCVGEIEALKLFEQAVEETRAIRTLKEAERIAGSAKRDPPVNYQGLKLMAVTHKSTRCMSVQVKQKNELMSKAHHPYPSNCPGDFWMALKRLSICHSPQ
jgi:hypothetical protein